MHKILKFWISVKRDVVFSWNFFNVHKKVSDMAALPIFKSEVSVSAQTAIS